eukprot:gene537-574_t
MNFTASNSNKYREADGSTAFVLLPDDRKHDDVVFNNVERGPYVNDSAKLPYNGCDNPPQRFIGRKVIAQELYAYFVRNKAGCLTLKGEQGVGKTAVALWVCAYMTKRRVFEAIYYLSLPRSSLRPEYVASLSPPQLEEEIVKLLRVAVTANGATTWSHSSDSDTATSPLDTSSQHSTPCDACTLNEMIDYLNRGYGPAKEPLRLLFVIDGLDHILVPESSTHASNSTSSISCKDIPASLNLNSPGQARNHVLHGIPQPLDCPSRHHSSPTLPVDNAHRPTALPAVPTPSSLHVHALSARIVRVLDTLISRTQTVSLLTTSSRSLSSIAPLVSKAERVVEVPPLAPDHAAELLVSRAPRRFYASELEGASSYEAVVKKLQHKSYLSLLGGNAEAIVQFASRLESLNLSCAEGADEAALAAVRQAKSRRLSDHIPPASNSPPPLTNHHTHPAPTLSSSLRSPTPVSPNRRAPDMASLRAGHPGPPSRRRVESLSPSHGSCTDEPASLGSPSAQTPSYTASPSSSPSAYLEEGRFSHTGSCDTSSSLAGTPTLERSCEVNTPPLAPPSPSRHGQEIAVHTSLPVPPPYSSTDDVWIYLCRLHSKEAAVISNTSKEKDMEQTVLLKHVLDLLSHQLQDAGGLRWRDNPTCPSRAFSATDVQYLLKRSGVPSGASAHGRALRYDFPLTKSQFLRLYTWWELTQRSISSSPVYSTYLQTSPLVVHGYLSRNDSERKLEGKRPGTFLVRFSESQPGQLVVSFVDLCDYRYPSGDDCHFNSSQRGILPPALHCTAFSNALSPSGAVSHHVIEVVRTADGSVSLRLKAINSAENLVTNRLGGVDSVIGPTFTGTTQASSQIFAQYAISQVGWSSDSTFSFKANYPYYASVTPSDGYQGYMLASLCKNVFGWTKVSLFVSDDFFDSIWGDLRSALNVRAMRGVIGLVPTVNLSDPSIVSFVNRFRSLPPSVIVRPDGSLICRNDTDTDGATYLFKGNPSGSSGPPYECTGLVYSSYPADGSTISNLTYYVYDAVIAMAHAIDAVTKHGTSPPASYRTPRMREALLQNVSFEGVTGRVSFSQGLGGYQNYGAGTRRTGALYKIANYQLCTDSGGVQTVCQRTVGHMHSEKGYIPCNQRDSVNCPPVVYNTPSNTKPLDWPDPEVIYLPSSSVAVLWFFVALLVLLILIFGTMVYRNMDSDVILAGQAHILFFLLFGVSLGVGRIINAAYPPTDLSCVLSVWLSHASFGIVFSVLVSKTWRVHLLLDSRFQRISVTSAYVNNVALSCLLFLAVYLAVLTAVSRPHREYYKTYSGNRTLFMGRCELRNKGMSTALIAIEGLTVVIGIYLCWLTRGAMTVVNANKTLLSGAHLFINTNVMLAIYMVLLVCIVEFAATYLISLTLPSLILVDNLGFFVALLSALLAIFVPKAVMLATKITDLDVATPPRNVSLDSSGHYPRPSIQAMFRPSISFHAAYAPSSRHGKCDSGHGISALRYTERSQRAASHRGSKSTPQPLCQNDEIVPYDETDSSKVKRPESKVIYVNASSGKDRTKDVQVGRLDPQKPSDRLFRLSSRGRDFKLKEEKLEEESVVEGDGVGLHVVGAIRQSGI